MKLKCSLIILITVFIVGCGTAQPNNAPSNNTYRVAQPLFNNVQIPQTVHKIEKIREGMSKQDVTSLFGQADKISDMCCSEDKPKIWTYQSIKCFEPETRPLATAQYTGECEVHFDKKSNTVVGWDKGRSRMIVTQQQCYANCP